MVFQSMAEIDYFMVLHISHQFLNPTSLCWKFHVCGHIHLRSGVIQKVKILHEDWKDSLVFSRYPTDGLVVKVNSHKLQAELGSGSVAPRWAIAVKEWKDLD